MGKANLNNYCIMKSNPPLIHCICACWGLHITGRHQLCFTTVGWVKWVWHIEGRWCQSSGVHECSPNLQCLSSIISYFSLAISKLCHQALQSPHYSLQQTSWKKRSILWRHEICVPGRDLNRCVKPTRTNMTPGILQLKWVVAHCWAQWRDVLLNCAGLSM